MELNEVLGKLGKGFLFQANDYPEVSCISTGSLAIDRMLGTGGWPRGSWSEIFGRPNSGKTTLGYALLGQCTAGGEEGLYIGAESKIAPDYMRRIVEAQGGNMDFITILAPNPKTDGKFTGQVLTGEHVMEIVQSAVGNAGAIVIDSAAALLPAVEADGDMSDRQPGLQARLISKALRKIVPVVALTDTVILVTNQVRDNIGRYGRTEQTPGGWKLKFDSLIRCRAANCGTKKIKGTLVGSKHHIKVYKNQMTGKVGAETDFFISRISGIDPIEDIMTVAEDVGVTKRGGGYYYYPYDSEDHVARGSDNFKEYLESNPEVFQEIKHKTRIALGIEEGDKDDED